MDTRGIVDYITRIVEPITGRLGLELVEVTFRNEDGRWILRVTIDHENGVKVRHCTVVSRELGVHLEVEDPISVQYNLEVSSPGLNRPLKNERDFERFTGRQVSIKTHRPVAGRRKLQGILEGVEDGVARVRMADGTPVEVPLEDMSSARLTFDL
ncbi:MAG TPA: ribosome maturation factor RimP [Proteobacteria bacterium]|nr:ribosome maturation factor RimP [bacterium BMS3Abin14]HDL52533.1 ribosome maturation factor RimP [Pseudomonadota bacterium]